MADKGRKSKGNNVRRTSPRKKGKMFSRPFTAPRTKTVKKNKVAEESDVQVIEKESVTDNDSQVELVTETQNLRDIEATRLAIPPLVNSYRKGIKLMSAREADEEAKYGEVLRWSSDSDDEEIKVVSKPRMLQPEKGPRKGIPSSIIGVIWL